MIKCVCRKLKKWHLFFSLLCLLLLDLPACARFYIQEEKGLDGIRGIIEAPELDETLEFGHVLKSFTKDSTPSIVCRFKSRNFKKIWREHSGGVIADYNKKMSDNWKKPTLFPTLRIGNDLTKANRRVMSQLYDDKTVSKVRLGNQVQFQLASSPTTWRSVHNPFTDNIAKMQIEIKSVYHNPLLNQNAVCIYL